MLRRSLASLVVVVLAAAACAGPGSTGEPSTEPSPSTGPTPGAPTASAPPPTPSPTAAVPTGEVRWEAVASLEAAPIDVVPFDDGYVLLALDGIRYSPDGVRWAKRTLPGDGDAVPDAIATDGRRVVVTGAILPCGTLGAGYEEEEIAPRCREHPAAWASEDGRTWRSASWTGPVHASSEQKTGSLLFSVWALPGGSFEALQGFWTGDLEEDPMLNLPALWRSADGLRWTSIGPLLPPPQASVWYDTNDLSHVAVDATGRRVAIVNDAAAVEGGCASVYESIDGVHYARIDGAVPCDIGIAWLRPVAPGGGWLLVGTRGTEVRELVMQTSSDLRSWTAVALPVGTGVTWAWPDRVAETEFGSVLVGSVYPAGDGSTDATWLSDAGGHWRLVDQGSLGGWSTWLATGAAGTLAVSLLESSEGDETSVVSVYRLAAGGSKTP